jgi:hypothetical protein
MKTNKTFDVSVISKIVNNSTIGKYNNTHVVGFNQKSNCKWTCFFFVIQI